MDGWVFLHKQPLIIQDALHDTRVFREVDRVLEDATYSICAVPMLIKGEPIGVMEAVNKLGHANYTEEDVYILETLAAQAAVVIQNQNLLDKAQGAYRQLLELDRMKSDFIAISSHELRIPLGLILGHASLLQEEASGESRIQLDTIVRNAMHLKDIIEDLADVDNFQTGLGKIRHRRFAMDRLIKDVVSSYQELARERNVSLRVSVNKADVVVDGDAHKLRIALGNLVKNALTFTDPGDRVLVTGEQIPGFVKVSVIDNGIGIPEKEMERIFERFFQVETHLTRRHGGMGLGLGHCPRHDRDAQRQTHRGKCGRQRQQLHIHAADEHRAGQRRTAGIPDLRLAQSPRHGYNLSHSGCGSVRLEYAVRDREIEGSNPSAPTIY